MEAITKGKAMEATTRMAKAAFPKEKVAQVTPLFATTLNDLIAQKEECFQGLPLHLRLYQCMSFWKKHAPPSIQALISRGIQPEWEFPPKLSTFTRPHSREEEDLANEIMLDYHRSGAAKLVEPEGTGHLVPWFVISKREGSSMKHRLISDCREINHFFSPKKFKLEHLQMILPHLRKGQWAAKVDLKDAYFHPLLAHDLKTYQPT